MPSPTIFDVTIVCGHLPLHAETGTLAVPETGTLASEVLLAARACVFTLLLARAESSRKVQLLVLA